LTNIHRHGNRIVRLRGKITGRVCGVTSFIPETPFGPLSLTVIMPEVTGVVQGDPVKTRPTVLTGGGGRTAGSVVNEKHAPPLSETTPPEVMA
jgi:hypothetical protein